MPQSTFHKLLEPTKRCTKRHVTYVAPEPEVIDAYAEAVCMRLWDSGQEPKKHHEWVNGLSTLMKVVTRISTKHINRGTNVCRKK